MTEKRSRLRSIRALAAAAAIAGATLAASGTASAAVALPPGYQLRVFAAGGQSLTHPDDIAQLGKNIYVAYQNNTNPDGTPPGATSTIVGYRPDGTETGTWSLAGHCDGLTADSPHKRLLATVNEDANSSLYAIDPLARTHQLRHYTYSPDPASLTGGGTDAISIVNGKILISASNPSPSTPGGSTYTAPAVFTTKIHGSVAQLTPTFYDNASATDAISGKPIVLNLSDPDSNAVVPAMSPRFAGDFMLVSQSDSELVFAKQPASYRQSLTRLMLSSTAGAPQVDDVSWASKRTGTLLLVDAAQNQIDAITGPFNPGAAFVAIPGDSQALAGDLGTIDLTTGAVTPFGTGFSSPKGLLFVTAL